MKIKYPLVTTSGNEPLENFFIDANRDEYSVARLIHLSKDLEPFDCPIAALNLSSFIWNDNNILDLAQHVKQCIDADLSMPIIIAWDGSIADGRHRIIKAIISGHATIKAVRMTHKPYACRLAQVSD